MRHPVYTYSIRWTIAHQCRPTGNIYVFWYSDLQRLLDDVDKHINRLMINFLRILSANNC